jgi:hypothetical protein
MIRSIDRPSLDPPDPPSWGRVEAVAHIARLSVPSLISGVTSGRVRQRRINGQLHIAIEDALALASETLGTPTAMAPLNDRVAARRAAGEGGR